MVLMDWTLILIVLVIIAVFLGFRLIGSVSSAAAIQYLRQGAKVIDVRNVGEFRLGHLPNAINIPLAELGERISRQVPNKEDILLLHCLSGGRSGLGRRILKRMGYTRVFNLGSYRRAEKIVREAGK